MVFEMKLIRRIFGPTKERDGTWKIKTNDELDESIRHKNIINHIKAQRLSWFGHLHRMTEKKMVKDVNKWKLMLTFSNPIFLPIAYSPALICFGRERGW
jgi:hypothetical protein